MTEKIKNEYLNNSSSIFAENFSVEMEAGGEIANKVIKKQIMSDVAIKTNRR
jgi:hypothetical protein